MTTSPVEAAHSAAEALREAGDSAQAIHRARTPAHPGRGSGGRENYGSRSRYRGRARQRSLLDVSAPRSGTRRATADRASDRDPSCCTCAIRFYVPGSHSWRSGRILRLDADSFATGARAVKRAHARQLAHREFSTGHARGGQRNRILLFVSIGERYVEIIADHETHAAVEGLVWDQMVSNFVAKVKTGRIADGVLAAIESCGAVLGRHHPVASGR